MPMENLIEYSDNYLKRSEGLWQYYTNQPVGAIVNSKSIKFKIRITEKSLVADNEKDVEIAVPSLEMPLINCEINLYQE